MNRLYKVLAALFALVSVESMNAMKQQGQLPASISTPATATPEQRGLTAISRLEQGIEDILTKEEQEAIDADIAFEMMREEFAALRIDPVSSARLDQASYVRQQERNELFDGTAHRSSVRPEPVIRASASSSSSTVHPLSPNDSRLSLRERVDTVLSTLETSLRQSVNERPLLKHIVLCGKNTETLYRIKDDITSRGNLWVRDLINKPLGFYHSWKTEDVLKHFFREAQRGNRERRGTIIIVDLMNLMTNSPEDELRSIQFLRDSTRELSPNYTILILTDSLDRLDNEYLSRSLAGKLDFITVRDNDVYRESHGIVRVRVGWLNMNTNERNSLTTNSNVVDTSSRNLHSSTSDSSDRRTSATSASRMLQSPAQNNARSVECPICFEKRTCMNTPCCLTKICAGCWEQSLQSTAQAGYGGHARQCPFCKAKESTWL